jgi:2-amino-4-hydroxy-6-hydroxymethyldihydropteridine diphosphokinase
VSAPESAQTNPLAPGEPAKTSRLAPGEPAKTSPLAPGEQLGYLGLGSNIGDRAGHLQWAADELGERAVRVLRSSSLYDTDPVGDVLDQDSFLTGAREIATTLDPIGLLDACKSVEQARGRLLENEPGYVRHGPRALDIDLLLLGNIALEHERLTLPHDQVLARRFVLIPLLELDLELTTPDGRRVAGALEQLPLDEGVRRVAPPLRVA